MSGTAEDVELLTAAQVAVMFRVDPKTVTRWGAAGRLARFRTPGGMSWYYGAEVRALLAGESAEAARKMAEADRDRLAGSS
jgi:hypothetical protein